MAAFQDLLVDLRSGEADRTYILLAVVVRSQVQVVIFVQYRLTCCSTQSTHHGANDADVEVDEYPSCHSTGRVITNTGSKHRCMTRGTYIREAKKKTVNLSSDYHSGNQDWGRGGGASGCGAKIKLRGGVVWLSSLSSVAMIDRPANDRPASAFNAWFAPSVPSYLT